MKIPLDRKMNLLDQPEELIIEQLRYLPLSDLLSACQMNSFIQKICQGRRLWEFRLMDEFRVTNLKEIHNPREYYFDLVKKRREILKIILAGNYLYLMWDAEDPWGNSSPNEFCESQREKVKDLTEAQITDAFRKMKLNQKSYVGFEEMNQELGQHGYQIGFFFDPKGRFQHYVM